MSASRRSRSRGAMAKALHLPANSGALLAGVQSDSPAAKAGLQPVTSIKAVNGTEDRQPQGAGAERRLYRSRARRPS